MLRPLALLLSLFVLLALAAGCGDSADSDSTAGAGAGEPALDVAATTRQAADFAKQVGGERAAVAGILPANADPHDYEPRPSDARSVAEADVLVQSGGDLDEWLDGLVENAGGDAERVKLIDAVRTRQGDGETDPHWWQDPRNVERAVAKLRDTFTAADPDGRETYAANAERYIGQLRTLDTAIAKCMDSVPADKRRLVTNHDAFGYLADRYGIEVLGSVVPALSTAAQPSAGDLRRLVAAIRRSGVTTIFPESALQQRVEEAVARDAGIRVGEPLYADTLGPGEDATYLDALRHDAQLIAASFGAECRIEG